MNAEKDKDAASATERTLSSFYSDENLASERNAEISDTQLPTVAEATEMSHSTANHPMTKSGVTRSTPQFQELNPNLTNRLHQKRQVGDPPPFDRLIVGGTLSLGSLLLIGGIAILIVSLLDRSAYEGAKLDDFVSLGKEACLIESTASYEVVDEELDRLNHRCKERYEYNVRITLDDDEEPHANETFVSSPLLSTACSTICDICGPENFNGEKHYIGVSATRAGEPMTSQTMVECWAPRGPPGDLSGYYACGEGNENCYQLEDPSVELKDEMNSSQMGMIAAGVGLGGSVVLTAVGCYFVWRNRQAMKDDEEQMRQQSSNANGVENEEYEVE